MANTVFRTPSSVTAYPSDWRQPDGTRVPGLTLVRRGKSLAHLDAAEATELAAALTRLLDHLHEQEAQQ